MGSGREFGSEGLVGSVADYVRPVGVDLIRRTDGFFEWQDTRRQNGGWPYGRSLETPPGVQATVRTDSGEIAHGLNFASQDYLSLASHPDVSEAAIRAIRDFGPHSAGSPALVGNTRLSLSLESALAEFLRTDHVMLFPTGWGAGFGVIAGLVRPYDFVLLDQLAHACLQQGAFAATGNVRRHRHLDIEHVVEQLSEIRAKAPRAGILVVTEGLFSMDSDWPDLRRMQETCREFEATLMVDVAHDLGSLGSDGAGQVGIQGMLGEIDLVMGSFSKTFACNGGFVATHSRAAKQFLKYQGGPHIFSNAISPVQVAVASESLRIVRSAEGFRLRADLMTAVTGLRSTFESEGIECIGRPSAIVPVPVGAEAVGRIASDLIFRRGVMANLAEFPVVAIGSSRFRMQVQAGHTVEQTTDAAIRVRDALAEARAIVERLGVVGGACSGN